MCFSATASFVAGASLSTAGIITVRKVKKGVLLPFAAIPLLFGIQQTIEGLNWLSDGNVFLHDAATYAYVMFSHVLWPIYVPVAVRMIEPGRQRKKFLNWFILLGVSISIYILYYVFTGPVTSTLGARGIWYEIPFPNFVVVPLAYVFATCGSCFFSRHKFVRVFGMALFASLIIAYWFYQEAFTSVWCFFAAILSFIVIAHVHADAVESAKVKMRGIVQEVTENIRAMK
ncbi:MAG TPA: DUF6629 family protein [Candidatus Binatia bacterium]|jgi:hypothetical protein|nr:DUF6629 family protein [Candidatus Binatia bacterium]